MATITVRLDADGTPSPSHISINAGDIVAFEATSDTVMCVDPVAVFGAERFEFPAGGTVGLLVQSAAGFKYITRTGSLETRCDSRDRDKTSGGGGGPG